jgi:hypothetical protein
VLQEFFLTVTRKVAKQLTTEEATAHVRDFAAWRIFAPRTDNVPAAIALHAQAKIAFWDAMMSSPQSIQGATSSGPKTSRMASVCGASRYGIPSPTARSPVRQLLWHPCRRQSISADADRDAVRDCAVGGA